MFCWSVDVSPIYQRRARSDFSRSPYSPVYIRVNTKCDCSDAHPNTNGRWCYFFVLTRVDRHDLHTCQNVRRVKSPRKCGKRSLNKSVSVQYWFRRFGFPHMPPTHDSLSGYLHLGYPNCMCSSSISRCAAIHVSVNVWQTRKSP